MFVQKRLNFTRLLWPYLSAVCDGGIHDVYLKIFYCLFGANQKNVKNTVKYIMLLIHIWYDKEKKENKIIRQIFLMKKKRRKN